MSKYCGATTNQVTFGADWLTPLCQWEPDHDGDHQWSKTLRQKIGVSTVVRRVKVTWEQKEKK